MTNAKPTPGPWEYVPSTEHHGAYVSAPYGGDICDCYAMSNPSVLSTRNGGTSYPIPFQGESSDANAALIAEAGTVYHETGLTPRQLQQQRDELLEALNWIAGVANINYQQDRKLRSDSARTLARIIKKADTAIAAAKAGAA